MSRKGMAGIVLSVALGAGAVGFAFAVRSGDPGPPEKAVAAKGASLLELRWEGGGVAFSPPPNWTPGEADDDAARLLVAPGGRNSLLVRALPLPFPVSDETLPSMKEYAARLVSSGDGVTVNGGPEDLEVAGMRGFVYRYGFQDAGSGQRGVHDHFFFFQGPAMITAVFQALPEGEYATLAPVVDSVLGSFQTIGATHDPSAPDAGQAPSEVDGHDGHKD